jgi:CheY-like chemotaxis protein
MMPEMGGRTVLRALKADPKLRDVPAVMLSIRDDKTRGYSLGATDCLVKPIDSDALRRVLHCHTSSPHPRHAFVVERRANPSSSGCSMRWSESAFRSVPTVRSDGRSKSL